MLLKIVLALFFPISTLCHDFYITQPWAETKWKAGDTVKINWKLSQNIGPEAIGVNIDLMDGDDMSANFLLNIAHNLPVESNEFEWTIPKTVSSSDGVFIRITGVGEVPNYRFSHRFAITDGEGPGLTMTAIPPVGPTLNVSELVRSLPTIKKPNKIPPPVKLIDPDAVEFVTETVSVVEPSSKNRDRLAQSEATSMTYSVSFLLFAFILGLVY